MFETQKRAIILAALVLAIGGIIGWNRMPKQEDPRFPARFASITVTFPGAGANTVDRLVVKPLERELRGISEIRNVRAISRQDVAVAVVELEETVYDTDAVWDEVDTAVDRAERDFPEGVGPAERDYEVGEIESVTFALTGSRNWATLLDAAERLEEQLLRRPGVKRVVFTPDFDTQVKVELAPEQAYALSVSAQSLAELIKGRATVIPGGTTRVAQREVTVLNNGRWESLEELRRLAVPLPDGRVLPLQSIARVGFGPSEPVRETVRFNGERAVIVGVVPQEATDLVVLGEQLGSAMPALEAEVAPFELHRLTNQPARVESRLADLRGSLLHGILIVATVVMLAMGLRIGGTVALSVPMVSLISILVYYVAGGVLHQITVAALVVSLGLLVDNAIVVSERIQWHLDRGAGRGEAASYAVRELAYPLAAATGTTLAAFLPLLLSKGVSADFTRAIPQVVMLTLSVSFLFALTVIPTIGTAVFRPSRRASAQGTAPKLFQRIAQLPVRRPGRVLLAAGVLLLASAALLPLVRLQFFPGADRNQVVLELELPSGSTSEATSEAAWLLERELISNPRVRHVAAFVGRSTPAFYYNLVGRSNAPNFAQLLVTTQRERDVPGISTWSREFAKEHLPGTAFVARPLEQGPPAAAPVEIRLYADKRHRLTAAVQGVFEAVKQAEGTRDVRHDMDLGSLALAVEVDDAASALERVSPADASLSLLSRTRGIPAGEYRGSTEPAEVVVRSPAGRDAPTGELLHTLVPSRNGRFIPLSAVAASDFELQPSRISRRNGRLVASVFAELGSETGYNEVLGEVEPRLGRILPEGVSYQIGGIAESSGDANAAILDASYLGVAVLLFVLLLQFRSFRRVGLVLLTVPLAAIGVVPGLVIFSKPFGFTSMLGAISLTGIVVNNAIILIDTIETRRRRGEQLAEALPGAVLERMRPILLTVSTTVLALVPLQFSSSSLWPPFASALISGLLASTVMTLLVVPAAYYLIFSRKGLTI
jgi:multidrug efflux pump subunit AcrB